MKIFSFIDESGSPDFFGKKKRPLWLDEGFQPLLMLGILQTKNRKKLRKAVAIFQEEILNDVLYNEIPSVKKANWFLHAKDDHPEVRIRFLELIRKMDFINCSIIVARKQPDIFINKHNGNANEFYFDVLHHLIKQLTFEDGHHYAYYLARRTKPNLGAFTESIDKVMTKLTKTEEQRQVICTYSCDVVKASEFPEMSVLDYLIWVVQRYIFKGERRYLTALEDKFELIYDVYDDAVGNNLYNEDNRFLLEKATTFPNKK